MEDYNQKLFQKLKRYKEIAKDLADEIKSLERWLKEATETKDEVGIDVASKELERKKLILDAVETTIIEIDNFLEERMAETKTE